MFSYLRYFAIISLLVVIVVAYVVGIYFKSVASQDLKDLVSQNNVALSQGYVNSVWKKHHKVLMALQRLPVEDWKKYKQYFTFSNESLDYFTEMSIVINLYTRDGKLIMAQDHTKTAANFSPEEVESFQIASGGDPNSRIVENATFYIRGKYQQGTLVQSYIPIMSDYYVDVMATNKKQYVEAVIEVSFDITNEWNKLFNFQIISTGGIILIFVVLILVLFVSSRKAESIIARQHEVNLELTAAASAAEAESRDKSQFLANISHELRTPLNAIIGFSEIIKNEGASKLADSHKEYINDIHQSGLHLLSLINDILDISKAEAGKLEVQITEFDAIKMIKNSMRLVIPRAEQAQVTLVEDLPDKHFTMQTDAKKIKQVLLNVLSNAVKFTPAGGQVRVTLRHNIADDTVIMQIKDTGIGISPKDISRVMQPFGQVDSTLARKYEGTGLGLPLSKKFVEILGGNFNISSEVNQGTLIIITLPRLFRRDTTSA